MGTGTVRSVIREKGGKVGGWIADRVDDVIGKPREAGQQLSGQTAQEDAYDPEYAKIEETRRINESLREYTRSLEPIADKFEKDCLKACKEGIDHLVEDIKKINNQKFNGKKLNINVERLERKLQTIERTVNGTIKKRLSKKVSIDDAECLRILKMPRGAAKEKAMNEFSNRVFQNALIELSDSIREIVSEQCTLITEQIEDRLENITSSLQQITNQFEELENLKSKDLYAIEKKKVELTYTLALCDVALAELNESKGRY